LRTVPTGVDTEFFQPEEEETTEGILFTGSMDWASNEDAVIYFKDQILPIIRDTIPGVTFWVVGRRPRGNLRALQGDDTGIRVTGTVEDIRPFFRRAGVYVVPLRSGSGTRLKIFEAMAAGKAVVSTTLGAEGLPVTNGENIILVDEPSDFALAVIGLLREPKKRRSLGSNARRLVEENFSWETVSAAFQSALGPRPSVPYHK